MSTFHICCRVNLGSGAWNVIKVEAFEFVFVLGMSSELHFWSVMTAMAIMRWLCLVACTAMVATFSLFAMFHGVK